MLDVLYEDDELWVYDKPTGVALLKDRSGAPCLWDELTQRGPKPFLVHRLDKGTSGCLIVAKHQAAQTALTRAFAARAVHKVYVALVAGRFPAGLTQVIELPLCRGRKSRYRVAGQRAAIRRTSNVYAVEQDRPGLPALTRVRRVASGDGRSLVVAMPVTGRTHQLRVHLAWIGFPVVGDTLYGRPSDPAQAAPRLHLHCHRMGLGSGRTFTAPLPEGFTC